MNEEKKKKKEKKRKKKKKITSRINKLIIEVVNSILTKEKIKFIDKIFYYFKLI
jgi:hypothetical protein